VQIQVGEIVVGDIIQVSSLPAAGAGQVYQGVDDFSSGEKHEVLKKTTFNPLTNTCRIFDTQLR